MKVGKTWEIIAQLSNSEFIHFLLQSCNLGQHISLMGNHFQVNKSKCK